MINSLLTFGAKSVCPKILEKTLTIRADVVDELEKNCINKTLSSTTWQSLIIATRGSGKTHIVKVLYHRLKNNNKISKKSVIAYMSEDEIGIANFQDLMISILRAFIRYKEPGSEILESQIIEASKIKDSNKREIFIKDTLNKFASDRIIILLIENFDKILNSLGTQGQGSLRSFIHQYNNLSIIATSQNLISHLQDSKKPFYNFFNIYTLNKLSFKEAVQFLEKIAETENKQSLIDEIKKPSFEGKLRAIYSLTEGNHRLLVTFYSFLKAEYKSELSKVFIKVMNDLKPYYEQFVNVLPAQQQKIVKYLSLNRRAVSGKEIAQSCFIDPNVFSKQISLLYQKGLIDKNKSGKDVFYELKEPLMRICFEISEYTNGIAQLFVDFLSSFYDSQKIRNQYLIFKYGAKFQNEELRQKYENEALLYNIALDKKELAKISFAHKIFERIDNYSELSNIIDSQNNNIFNQINIAFESFNKGNTHSDENQFKEALDSYKKAYAFDPENDDICYKIGVSLANLGKYEDAQKYFKKSIKLNSKNDFAYNGLGVVYGNLNKHESALINFHKAIEINPKNSETFNNIGNALDRLGKNEEAITNYKKAIKINSKNDAAYNGLGAVYGNLNKHEEALSNFQMAIDINPLNYKALMNMGSLMHNIGKYSEAVKYYQKAIKLNPENHLFYYRLANSLAYLNQNEKAIINLKKTIEINPDSIIGYNSLGYNYFRIGENEKAISSYNKAIEINSKDYLAFYGLGKVLMNLNKNEEAVASYQKAIELNPENNNVYDELGLVYYKLGKNEDAATNYQKSIELNPKNDITFNNLGITLANLGEIEEAITNYQKAIEINPKNHEAFYNMGNAIARLGKNEDAIIYYKKAIEINPEKDEAFNNLGITLANLGKNEEAIINYQKVIEINPKNYEAFYNIGNALARLGKNEDAITNYKKAIELNSENDIIYNNLAFVYLQSDKVDNAIDALRRGLEVNPNSNNLKFSLLGVNIRINDQSKSKKLLTDLIKKADNDLLAISLSEDIFYNLFKYGSNSFIESYFGFIINVLLREKKEVQLWKALSDSLFEILINIEDYDKERLNNIKISLIGLLEKYEESKIPIKMFTIGIAYLKENKNNSIYELSKEERKLFKIAVLDKRT